MDHIDNSFFLCACAQTAAGGIYRYHVSNDGVWQMKNFHRLEGSNYLCYSPDYRFLYATFNDSCGGGVAAFQIQKDYSLKALNRMYSMGKSNCHLTCSPDGKFLFCANYSSGNVAAFSLTETGMLSERVALIQHHGSGPRKDRQECAHTHCTRITPDGRYLTVVDLGVDGIYFYPLHPVTGIANDPRICQTEPGDGPRHILFDDSGTLAYVINELGNSVSVYRYEDGSLTLLDNVTSLPENYQKITKASAVRFSPDRRFVYASNRGLEDNSIACYKIDEQGMLTLFDIVDSHGNSPRDINFLPDGKFLAASNEFSDNISLFRWDPSNGHLYYLENCDLTGIPRPLCIEY